MEGADEAEPGAAERLPSGPPSRAARNVVIGMVAFLFVAANVANYLGPSVVDKYPVEFIAMSSTNRNLVLASGNLDPWTFYLVGFVRLVLSDPLFFLLGRWYGDAGIRWMERRSPMYGRMLRTAEGWFKKASYPVIAIAPNNYFCLFAGASGMPIAGFLVANVVGTIARLFLLRSFGNLFDSPLDAVRHFITRNRIAFLIIGVVALAGSLWADRRSGGEIEGVLELDREVAAAKEDQEDP
jgi:membrane protein DedA with SNARE-associated domain